MATTPTTAMGMREGIILALASYKNETKIFSGDIASWIILRYEGEKTRWSLELNEAEGRAFQRAMAKLREDGVVAFDDVDGYSLVLDLPAG